MWRLSASVKGVIWGLFGFKVRILQSKGTVGSRGGCGRNGQVDEQALLSDSLWGESRSAGVSTY